uniref:Olfactory receptor family 52 subfamily B member 2 n=1 Tax=Jaculus jaculus TaxID=51337 RepID=A0A8C5L8W5_JACJA
MSHTDGTISHPAVFLRGIPGLEAYHIWLSTPLCPLYFSAVLGNSILIVVMATEHILLPTTPVPKALAIFGLHARDIAFDACVTQVFLVRTVFVGELAILLAMAFDGVVALRAPLRYSTVLTWTVVGRIALAIITQSFCIIFPVIRLLKPLPFCRTDIVPHLYCERIRVALPMVMGITDVILTAVSYSLILRAVFRLPSQDGRDKALSACGSHLCVILISIPQLVHILLANLYLVTKQTRDGVAHGFLDVSARCCPPPLTPLLG